MSNVAVGSALHNVSHIQEHIHIWQLRISEKTTRGNQARLPVEVQAQSRSVLDATS